LDGVSSAQSLPINERFGNLGAQLTRPTAVFNGRSSRRFSGRTIAAGANVDPGATAGFSALRPETIGERERPHLRRSPRDYVPVSEREAIMRNAFRMGRNIMGEAARRHLFSLPVVLLTTFATALVSEGAAAQASLDGKNAAQVAHRSDRSQQPVAADAMPPFTMQFKGHITIRDDRTATEVTTRRIKILTQGVVQSLSQQQVQFVEGMQKLETLEAFTEKADGRHVAVDAANIMTRDAASGLQATYASDLKVRTFIFPDVAVGDTLVMTLRSDILRDFFTGQLTDFDVFPRSQSVTSAQYTIEAPTSLDLSVRVAGNGASSKTEVVGGVRRHLVEVTGAAYRPEEPGAVSPFDRDPYMAISTFHSYEELGLAYGKTALPQAKPTAEVSALADEITRGITDRRAQAAAIDAWVKQNIRYVAIYLSVGRVVPHDAATVLKNKFGDCKDKVTLMSALLMAKGIASEAALINLGPAYSLPEPPTLAVLNHVIVYLPEFDLFDDPTANVEAFGTLTAETYDKPVVRVSATGASLARTPAMKLQDHTVQVKTTVRFAADGTISGQTEESSTGVLAGGLRYAEGLVQQVGQETMVQRQLQSFATPGSGHFELGGTAELHDPAVIKNEFELNDRFRAPAPEGVAAIPVGMPFSVRLGNYLFGARLSGRQSAFACLAGSQSEDIDAIFDPALPMPRPLTAISIDNAIFTYRSSYRIENRTLKIHREFVSRVSRQVCPAETEAQITADLNKVRTDVYSGYRFGAAPPPRPVETKAPPVTEMTSQVIADQSRQIGFLYEIKPDCSTAAFATVSTIESPRHGKLSIDRGTGYSNFPQSNPRFDCNKNQSEGVKIAYEPDRGFIGDDTLTVDILYADKSVSRRHYAIKVEPSPAEPASASTKPQSSAQITEVARVVARDQRLRVATLYDLNPDCSVIGIPTVRIIESSKNGGIIVEKGSGFPSYPANNPRSRCNSNAVDGEVIFYMPEFGYVGADAVLVEIIYPDGTARTRRYAIEVK
jgi:Domain of Unknown Function with PDB structure (DUF3857)/Transglutaminase-like superfamily